MLSAALRGDERLLLEALPPSGLAYLIAGAEQPAPLLIVTPTEERAETMAADLRGFGVADVVLFPGEPHGPFEDVSPDPRGVFGRLAVRQRILAGGRPQIVVAPAVAVAGHWMPEQAFAGATTLWVEGEEIPRDQMTAHLVLCGYQPVSLVEDEGTFAIRGGILDIFPPDRERPVRLDLFGDEIASIQTFDPSSQRTFEAIEALAVYPIREVLFDDATVERACAWLEQLGEDRNIPTRRLRAMQEEIGQRNYFYGVESLWPAFYTGSESVLATLAPDEVVIVLDEPDSIAVELERSWSRSEHDRDRALERHRPVPELSAHLGAPESVRTQLEPRAAVRAVTLAPDVNDRPTEHRLTDWRELASETSARREDASRGEILDPLVAELRRQFQKRHEVFIACSSRGHAERLRELLHARELDLPFLEALPDVSTFGQPRRTPRVAITVAPLSGGLLDLRRGAALITDVEVFGTVTRPRQRRRKQPPAEGLATLRDLSDGDLVIHVDHGIGRYLGLKRLILGGVDGDYVHLEYAGGDRLYLPVIRLNLLQRFRGPAKGVRLDKLGGSRWLKTKQRVKDAVLQLAHELLALQAQRQSRAGFALPEPDDHFRAFEATFPFEETPDQQRAIDEVLADLQRDEPMDRLICGDVGFGKTEVAIRAAFMAVTGGRQVAVLVPTTVLAEQHGVRFRERLAGEPVTVEVLSRFRAVKDVRDILARTRAGGVDILVGTHRLLSSDVGFKKLGLLVVDEEQRFGVKQKERIKQLRSQVHVLTLSATPIPRTLHMATTGLRDLSIIQTPPADRVSIRTEVTRFDEEQISEAIRRELHRGGQVFVVHNRVRSIGAMAEVVRRLVPEARVAVAHGQMGANELERVMVEFVRREHNILVSTAIIESGIDIPTANTMIVNRADMFGLSQLYQLRGRIGRGRDRGYAHLLLPRSDRVTRQASERLAVLKRFSDLGSGFQIASHDLDLRGAGDLLGASQSGHVAAVGFELYTELLTEAVEQVKGQGPRTVIEPEIKLPVSAVLPESYVPEPMQRLAFYQRMAQSPDDDTIYDVFSEIEERYGKAPDEARLFTEVMVIRRRLKELGASALSAATGDGTLKIGVTFVPEPTLDPAALTRRIQAEPQRYRLLPSGRLAVTVGAPSEADPRGLLRTIRNEIAALPLREGPSPVLARGGA